MTVVDLVLVLIVLVAVAAAAFLGGITSVLYVMQKTRPDLYNAWKHHCDGRRDHATHDHHL